MALLRFLHKRGLSKPRIRLVFVGFFLAFAVPTAVLIQQAYKQLKWETFHQHQLLAEELADRIDDRFNQFVISEEARSFADYAFLNVTGDNKANFLQRSPLSTFPPAGDIPGLIGYFQIDSYGRFSTPLLPDADTAQYGISKQERTQRLAAQQRLQTILSENRLVQQSKPTQPKKAAAESKPPQPRSQTLAESASAYTDSRDEDRMIMDAEGMAAGGASAAPEDGAVAEVQKQVATERDDAYYPAQAAFDQLNAPAEKTSRSLSKSKLGRIEDLKLDSSFEAANAPQTQQVPATPQNELASREKRAARKEREALPEIKDTAPASKAEQPAQQSGVKINIFESEIDPFEFSLLDSGHFVLYRKVWRNGQRYIQGILFEQQAFLRGLIESEFNNTALARMSNLIVGYQSDVFAAYGGSGGREYFSSAEELSGVLLYQTRLSAPFNEIDLIFNITQLPAGPGSSVVTWASLILMSVLCLGLYLLYRLALRQFELMQQQQNFVSAVSHELKTPLTSIRMYGEMLKAGWADESKKAQYYDFIYDESERLSRLIENVLQLARMTRNDLKLDMRPTTAGELLDNVRSKIASQIERAGFAVTFNSDDAVNTATISVDTDAFIQIVINLIDNALKFSRDSQTRQIEFGAALFGGNQLVFSIRDYGPGIAKDQIKKIFKLFYRSENELTRKTTGTGIGLALVHQLTLAMHGKIDVINRSPGAEFRIAFPATPLP